MARPKVQFQFEAGMKVKVIPKYSRFAANPNYFLPINETFIVRDFSNFVVEVIRLENDLNAYFAYRFMPADLTELERVIYDV